MSDWADILTGDHFSHRDISHILKSGIFCSFGVFYQKTCFSRLEKSYLSQFLSFRPQKRPRFINVRGIGGVLNKKIEISYSEWLVEENIYFCSQKCQKPTQFVAWKPKKYLNAMNFMHASRPQLVYFIFHFFLVMGLFD